MSVYTQQGRWLEIFTPLAGDTLLLRGFSAVEEMSGLFRIELELVSLDERVDARKLIGHPVLIKLKNPDGTVRPFHGYVSRFAYRGTDDRLSIYHADVVPWTWFLTQSKDCRIFQNKTIPQIIQEVFAKYGAKDFEISRILGKHPVWDYCVQYRESDFDFVSRLMEQEGIFYYFRHEADRHVMVLADSLCGYEDCAEAQVSFADNLSGGDLEDKIVEWEHAYSFRPRRFTQIDYNFEKPTANLLSAIDSKLPADGGPKTEIYDFPGEYEHKADGDTDARLRIEELESTYDLVTGRSKCRSFFPGGRFTLSDHHSHAEAGKRYVLLSVRHQARQSGAFVTGAASSEPDYQNSFTCIPAEVVFRPQRRTPKPQIKGIQTATVVGPRGQEIYLDKHGRVKVHFHWDRLGGRDEHSSCWIRVAQAAAGPNFGFVVHPRIGHEVVVHFLEGDPDRPLIMGCVYNAGNMPNPSNAGRKTPGPTSVDQAFMMTGVKSQSYGGSGGHNEITMNDAGGHEGLFFRAQKDEIHTVGNNRDDTVGNDETRSIKHDQTCTISNNRSLTVGVNETIHVGANRSETVGANESVSIGANRAHNVGVSDSLNVGATQQVSVGLAQTISVGATRTSTVGLIDTIKVGSSFSLDAGDEITLKTGDASITLKKDGTITLRGKDISVIATGNISAKASKNVVIKGTTISKN